MPIARIVAAALAVLLVGACGSKNPDSLVGMNLDENAAMMDANASSDAAANPTANASTDAGSANATEAASNASASREAASRSPSGTASARAGNRATSVDQEPPASGDETDATDSQGEDQTVPNQVDNESEPPAGG